MNRKQVGLFVVILYGVLCCDVIEILQTLDSPVVNPKAIEWDGSHFWVSTFNSSKLYKLDSNIQIVDSLNLSVNRVSGIAFRNDELWVTSDSAIRSGSGRKFFIYQISLSSGGVLDSLRLIETGPDIPDTNAIFGLGYFKGEFYVSFIPYEYQGTVQKIDPVLRDTTGWAFDWNATGFTEYEERVWITRGYNLASSDKFSDSNFIYKPQLEGQVSFLAFGITNDGTNFWLRVCRA